MNKPTAPSIMIITDDSHFVYLMQYYAKKSGGQAVIAPFDAQAVALAREEMPAVIVIESDSARGSGQDILEALRANSATCTIPVVVCSWQDRETNKLAKETVTYLQRPVSYKDLAVLMKSGVHHDT